MRSVEIRKQYCLDRTIRHRQEAVLVSRCFSVHFVTSFIYCVQDCSPGPDPGRKEVALLAENSAVICG